MGGRERGWAAFAAAAGWTGIPVQGSGLMGAVREMVSDGLYLAMIVHARGDMARVAAMLDLWECRYRDGRTGQALLGGDRGARSPVIAVAERHGIYHDTLRKHDREFRALIAAAMGEGLGAGVLVRAGAEEALTRPPGRRAPSPAGGGRGRSP